jgi:hypothetical protein
MPLTILVVSPGTPFQDSAKKMEKEIFKQIQRQNPVVFRNKFRG